MASVLVVDVISRAGILLQDTTKVRWPEEELANWATDGQREVVLIRPQACVTNAAFKLATGKTKQVLPDGVAVTTSDTASFASGILPAALMLIDVTRNLGADGVTAGKSIRLVSREVLDAQNPDWHNVTALESGPMHYTYDPRDPKNFYIYPKALGTAWNIELVYSSAPAAIALTGTSPNKTISNPTTQTLSIDDIYANSLVDYILYRAYSKDSTYSQNAQLAMAHYSAFQAALGTKSAHELAQNPNLNAGVFNPGVVGAARV